MNMQLFDIFPQKSKTFLQVLMIILKSRCRSKFTLGHAAFQLLSKSTLFLKLFLTLLFNYFQNYNFIIKMNSLKISRFTSVKYIVFTMLVFSNVLVFIRFYSLYKPST